MAMLDDRALMRDAVREMAELREGGTPGKTGNADAKFLADTFAAYEERSRTDLNRLGASIGKLDGRAGVQAYDPWKLLAAGRERWTNDVLPRLDPARAFPDLITDAGAPDTAAIRAVLDDVWTTITTGRDNTVTGREKGEFVGPANLARSLEKHRVLHYRDAESWLEIQDLYGHGGLFATFLAQQRRAARVAAQMQMLGPNPRVMLDAKLAQLQRRVRNDPAIADADKAKLIRQLTSEAGPIGNAVAEMTHLTSTPVDAVGAQIGAGIRAQQDVSKLGGAVLSAMPGDAVMGAANLRFNGKPLFDAYRDWIAEFFRGRGTGETRELAFLVGEAADGLIGHVIAADYAGDGAPGVLSKASVAFFKWSGLSWQTDAARAAGGRALAAWLGSHVDTSWDALPDALRRVFGLHGLDEAHWQAIRRAGFREVNGVTYVTPDRIAELPDEVIRPLPEERLEAMQAGIAERQQAAGAADVREAEWITGRVTRFHQGLAEARERLAALEAKKGARDEATLAAFRDRIDLLEASIDRAAAETDLIQSMRGLATIDQVRGWLRSVEDGVYADVQAARTAPRVERSLRQTYGAAEKLGRRIGNADRRITEIDARMRQAEREAGAAAETRGEAFIARWSDRQQELEAFIERMRERQRERSERLAGELADLPNRERRILDEARLDLELTLRRYFADEVSFGQIRSDEASRAMMLQGSRPGTPVGEALRFVMHFKGFPFAFSQRVLGRAIHGQPGATLSERLLHGAGHIGHLLAGLTVAGYVSMTMKDIVKGWDPRIPHDFKSLMKIAGASIVQGGGAGILGDFLFGEANRFGGGALATIAGPEIGTAADLFDLWNRTREGDFKAADGFRLLWGNTPFVNLFYVRPAVDYLFLNALYESMSPGYLRRQERNRRRDYGQERLWEAR